MKGYSDVATLMAKDPGLSIYRRFAHLNAKNLLYLQAELVYLEKDLNEIIKRDEESGAPQRENFPISLWHLKNSSDSEDDGLQWQKVLEIRELLDKYNKALIQQGQLLKFQAPQKNDFKLLEDWMKQEEIYFKFASEMTQWSSHEEDLIALRTRHSGEDHFTRWVSSKVIPWFHERWSRDSDARYDREIGIWHYDDRKIKSVTRTISIAISAILPASAMVGLYFIQSNTVRLIVIFVYNLVFSFSLGLLVKERPVEIFAAATAFAAVQVTLITNAPGSKTC